MVTERLGSTPVPPTPSRSAEELEAALAARDELISVMGHELRNAMSPLVLLAAQFELMPAADDMMKKKVAMLSRNLKLFTSTLDRIGEVSSLRAGKLDLDLETIDAEEVVAKVCRDLGSAAQAGGCELRCETASVIGRWDRERLERIVHHLVGNAIRYASGTPVEVALRGTERQLELVVQDEGPGIPATERERLFDRFDRKGARRSGGLGVGLWVVKALCHAMGGTVQLVDTPRGARFCVTLPRG
jgi:signal transduction histidine kinase